MSTDAYPTDEELKAIEEWDFIAKPNPFEFMNYVKGLWWMPDWGWYEEAGVDELFDRPVQVYDISTGGWSGNESLIASMERNWMFWSLYWVQTRRGGHFIFNVYQLPKETPSQEQLQEQLQNEVR